MNTQEELPTGGGKSGGRWQSWRTVNNRGRRASCSFTRAWHKWHRFWFLTGFNSIYPLEKMIQWCLGRRSFFSHHNWRCSTGLYSEWLLHPSRTVLCSGHVSQKLTVPPQIKKTISCAVNLCDSSSYFIFLLSVYVLSLGMLASLSVYNLKVSMWRTYCW